MSQKIRSLVAVVFLMHSISACAGSMKSITIHVHEEDGRAIEGALVKGRFFQDQVVQNEKRSSHHSLSDSKGIAKISGQEDIYVDIDITKDGFYENEKRVVVRFGDEFDVSTLLREKRNPIAMYAKKELLSARDTRKNGERFGYDFIAGDFVAPHGKGTTSDLLVTHTYRKENSFNYEVQIIIEFSGPQDGLVPFYRLLESKFTSSYVAPESGYENNWNIREVRKGKDIQTTRDRQRNYYVRVRTVVNDKGDIESAHYGKIYGEFPEIMYYLNPTPNDRNVEFDPAQNLFRDLKSDDRVIDP